MSPVRSLRWTPVLGWCAATATSIVLGWVALTPVLRPATSEDQQLAFPEAEAEGPHTPSATQAPDKTQGPDEPQVPKESPRPQESPRKSTSPTKSATTADGWTVTTADDGLRTYVRSFRVDGGQAVIRMTSQGKVELVTATPADGYAVQKVQDEPDNLAVYFNQTGHSFIIHATWWDDRPFAEVSEIGS